MNNKIRQIMFVSCILLAFLLQIGNNSALALSPCPISVLALKDLVVTPDEMKEWGDFSRPHDVTNEIADMCLHDCVKVTWGTTSDRLVLLMIRLKNPLNARRAAKSLQETYQSFGDRFLPYPNTENETQWSGWVQYSKDKFQWVAGDTQGSVLIFISYRKILNQFVADIDGGFYMDMVQSLTRIQKEKLREAGFAQ
ncbi:MAG: hypothetical protein DPW18_17850 [Chloroflexi bacterium]|nr:hypothetical protein [Chloroflexi bacterium CFX2]MCQ3938886.1 hypothetical protein [Chloroflexota bacterium]MDL1943575.1 hypothetical protein [Chloroflexi bacterium CFX2]